MLVTLFYDANDRLLTLFAGGLQCARAFREWYLSPSRREERGLILLREWLSTDQRAQYDTHKYFEVTGCHTGKRYRIYHGIGANVVELDSTPRIGWCFVPIDPLVAGDVMLAQKIALETDELSALASANNFSPK